MKKTNEKNRRLWKMIIYKIINLINGKIYIGKASGYNVRCNYLGSGVHLRRAIKLYGKENFIKKVIDFAETKEELNNKEIFWINFYGARNPEIGYNIAKGGDNGFMDCRHSRKSKQQIALSMLGEKNHMYGKRGENNPNYGKHRSEETKQLMSKIASDGRRKGENNPMFGRKREDTRIRNLRATGQNNPMSRTNIEKRKREKQDKQMTR